MQHLLVLSLLIMWSGVLSAVYGKLDTSKRLISDYVAESSREQLLFRVSICLSSALFLGWAYWLAYDTFERPVVFVIAVAAIFFQLLTTFISRTEHYRLTHDLSSNVSIWLFGLLALACAHFSESNVASTLVIQSVALATIAYMTTVILYVRTYDATLYGQLIVFVLIQAGLVFVTYS